MSSMSRSSNNTEPANTEQLRTHRRCCEKLTTSNNRRNTMWKKLCPQSSAAEETTNQSYTSSNGLTIRNARTGRRNHSTTFWSAVWRNSGSFIDEIQTCRGTTGSHTPRREVHKRAQQSMSGSRMKGLEDFIPHTFMTHGKPTFERNSKRRSNAKRGPLLGH